MGVRITKDNGDYFELTEHRGKVTVEFFKKEPDSENFERIVELDYDNLDDAMKALDSFEFIEDLVL